MIVTAIPRFAKASATAQPAIPAPITNISFVFTNPLNLIVYLFDPISYNTSLIGSKQELIDEK